MKCMALIGPEKEMKWKEMNAYENKRKWKPKQPAIHQLQIQIPCIIQQLYFSTPQLFGGGLLITSPQCSSYIIHYMPSNFQHISTS